MLYRFIAAPANKTKQQTYDLLKQAIANPPSADYAEISVVEVPEFKVGTLDTLMVNNDEFSRIDAQVESTVNKLVDYIRSLVDGNESQLVQSLTVNDRSVESSIRNFKWNGKFRVDRALKEIAETLQQEVNNVEQLVRGKMNNYNTLKGNLASIERKQVGNLSIRSLAEIVKKEHFIQDSEYLQTVLVAVPKLLQKEFLAKYESLTPMVVPRSCFKLNEDEDYILYGVVVFKKVYEEYVLKLREEKFIPRDFVYDEQRIEKEKKEQMELGSTAKEQKASLLRLCKTNFGEVFSAWLHVKIIRVFVDAVLRFGLPPDFQCMLVKAKPKMEKKALDTLLKHYASLGGSIGQESNDVPIEELQGLSLEKEFYPFVNMELNWNLQ